jgi:hypothetical protein
VPDVPAVSDEVAGLRAANARLRQVIRSYLSTAAKHGIGQLDALTRAASGTAWIPETA